MYLEGVRDLDLECGVPDLDLECRLPAGVTDLDREPDRARFGDPDFDRWLAGDPERDL